MVAVIILALAVIGGGTTFIGHLIYINACKMIDSMDKPMERKPGELRKGDKLPDGSTYDGYYGDWGC